MKKIFTTVVLCFLVIGFLDIAARTQQPGSLQDAIVGTWKTIDDEGPNKGKASSHIEILESESGGIYSGRIVKLLLDPPDKICAACKGPLKNKPLVSMTILNGMKKTGRTDDKFGEEYGGGTILDPDSGTTYQCKIWVKEDILTVRGYVGISLLGRSQQWHWVK